MIMSDLDIRAAQRNDLIVIEPYDESNLGPNSYDVHLAKTLAVYESDVLDSALPNPVRYLDIPKEGLILVPQRLYLASTVEYTETEGAVPWLDGKSGVGRLGISIHVTAGRGDVGFKGHWTMEIHVKQPVRVYAGMPIGQLTYFTTTCKPRQNYSTRKTSSYSKPSKLPVASRLYVKVRRVLGWKPIKE